MKARRTSSSVMFRFSGEDAGVVAADEEDLIALQFRMAVDGSGPQLYRGDQGR